MRRLLFLFSVNALLQCWLALTALPPFFHGRPSEGLRQYGDKLAAASSVTDWIAAHQATVASGGDPYPWLQRLNFTQTVNHFNESDSRTYHQRYWYNPKYTKNVSIVFLLIEGESPAGDLWVGYEGYQWLQMAKKHGADVFQLEHRCFGQSRLGPNLSRETLELCTVDQALEDIATFIKALNKMHNFVNPRWVTFGGSYPGVLSALFRHSYPELTAGAVSSSAPLYFTFDAWEYVISVEETLRTIPGCAEAVAESFTAAQELSMDVEGRKQLNQWLQLDPPFAEGTVLQHDIDNLFANLYAVFQGIVQYTRDGRNPIKRLRNVVKWFNSFPSNGGQSEVPFPNSYDDLIVTLKNETFDDPDLSQATNRGWIWLQCCQLGIQQTTDSGRSIFGQILPLNYFIDMCTDGFGEWLNGAEQVRRTDAVRMKHGLGYNYKASNIVLSNGSFDPWHKLGFYESDPSINMTAILIEGTAHCSDMYPVYDGEPDALAGARKIIFDSVASFLGEQP